MLRKFNGGAVRSSANGKLEWLGLRHPLVEKSFGEYMKRHTRTEDGGTRAYNNWWSLWSEEVSIQSMLRHVQDLECLHVGLKVYKVKLDDGEDTVVLPYPPDKLEDNWTECSVEETLNAIRFNTGSYMLKHLKTK
jgi:hypothetical protein